MRKFLFNTTLDAPIAGDEIDVQIEYGVIPGSKATMVDPGSEPDVEILRVWTISENGERTRAPQIEAIDELDRDLKRALLRDAAEQMEYARDDAADMRREDRLLTGRA